MHTYNFKPTISNKLLNQLRFRKAIKPIKLKPSITPTVLHQAPNKSLSFPQLRRSISKYNKLNILLSSNFRQPTRRIWRPYFKRYFLHKKYIWLYNKQNLTTYHSRNRGGRFIRKRLIIKQRFRQLWHRLRARKALQAAILSAQRRKWRNKRKMRRCIVSPTLNDNISILCQRVRPKKIVTRTTSRQAWGVRRTEAKQRRRQLRGFYGWFIRSQRRERKSLRKEKVSFKRKARRTIRRLDLQLSPAYTCMHNYISKRTRVLTAKKGGHVKNRWVGTLRRFGFSTQCTTEYPRFLLTPAPTPVKRGYKNQITLKKLWKKQTCTRVKIEKSGRVWITNPYNNILLTRHTSRLPILRLLRHIFKYRRQLKHRQYLACRKNVYQLATCAYRPRLHRVKKYSRIHHLRRRVYRRSVYGRLRFRWEKGRRTIHRIRYQLSCHLREKHWKFKTNMHQPLVFNSQEPLSKSTLYSRYTLKDIKNKYRKTAILRTIRYRRLTAIHLLRGSVFTRRRLHHLRRQFYRCYARRIHLRVKRRKRRRKLKLRLRKRLRTGRSRRGWARPWFRVAIRRPFSAPAGYARRPWWRLWWRHGWHRQWVRHKSSGSRRIRQSDQRLRHSYTPKYSRIRLQSRKIVATTQMQSSHRLVRAFLFHSITGRRCSRTNKLRAYNSKHHSLRAVCGAVRQLQTRYTFIRTNDNLYANKVRVARTKFSHFHKKYMRRVPVLFKRFYLRKGTNISECSKAYNASRSPTDVTINAILDARLVTTNCSAHTVESFCTVFERFLSKHSPYVSLTKHPTAPQVTQRVYKKLFSAATEQATAYVKSSMLRNRAWIDFQLADEKRYIRWARRVRFLPTLVRKAGLLSAHKFMRSYPKAITGIKYSKRHAHVLTKIRHSREHKDKNLHSVLSAILTSLK